MERWCTALSKFKRFSLLLLSLLLLHLQTGAEVAPALPPGYQLVAQNPGWELYLKEGNLGLIMRHRASGQAMMSTVENPQDYRDNDLWKGFYQSGIVLEYMEGTINKYPWANLITTPHDKAFTYLKDGFDCHVHYTQLGIHYTVRVRLMDNEIQVMIPQDSIREEMSDQYAVSSLYVYPFMGHTHMGQSGGYILIPDGQGALIELKDNEGRFASPYKATVYGSNIGLAELAQGAVMNDFTTGNPAERAMMPVFGIRHADKDLAFVSIIQSGDTSATLHAAMNGVGNMGFDWAGAQYTYRVVYAQSTGPGSGTVNLRTPRAKRFDILQRFRFLAGEEATYAGMAVSYRNHLREQGAFDGQPQDQPFGLQVDFLGGDRKKGLLGTEAVLMTTAAQAQDMLQRFHEAGLRHTLSVFKGWQNNGASGGRPVTVYHPAGNLGGSGDFAGLFAAAKAQGDLVLLEADITALNPDTAGTLIYSALKKVDSNTFSMNTYGRVYRSLQLLTPSKTLELAQALAAEFQSSQVPGAYLDGLTRYLYDYNHRQTYFDSTDCANLYKESAAAFSGQMPLALNNPNAYLWPRADMLTGLPATGSDYVYVSAEVPFLAIALSGQMPLYAEYTNFQANTRRFFLRLVEQGLRPAFLLTAEDPIRLQDTNMNHVYSSRFDLYEEMIAAWYKELSQLHSQLKGAHITSHSQVGSLRLTGWDNGLTVCVNLGDNDLVYKGILMPALDYKVVNTSDVQ